MDQILLDALNNLSLSLDQIAQALISRGDNSQSATTTALQSGDFSNQMMEISRGVQSIKADTQKILDNQATLIKMQKEKESEKTDIFDESGKKKSLVKDGVGSIILIAGAVLAIGLAFSVIGSVDWVSVMALSISLPLIAFAFEKIASIKELTTGRMMELAGVVTIMSLSILASSYILGGVQSVGISQLFTAVMVAGTLGVISLTIGGLFNSIKDISMVDALKASFIMPLVMMSMSYAIAQSSYFLSDIKSIGLGQAITAILIAGAFTVISYGMSKLLSSFKDISMADAIAAAVIMPLVLVGVSYAIAQSSHFLADVKSIGIDQAMTSILIAATFTIVAYGLGQMVRSFKGVSVGDALLSSITIPLLLIGISAAIVGSSYLISGIQDVSLSQLINFVLIGTSLSIVGLVVGLSLKLLTKIGSVDDYIQGGISLVMISTAIAVSSQILNLGNYGKYPSFDWSIGVGLSLLVFTLPIYILGKIDSSTIVKGSLAALLVAGAIVASSYILSLGKYDLYPDWKWAIGVGLSLTIFGLAASLLGLVAMSPTFYVGLLATLALSATIVGVSSILAMGDYSKYPSLDWAMGVGLVMGGFGLGVALLGLLALTPVFYVGLLATTKLADTVVETSNILASGNYSKYPSLDWAMGVGSFMSSFALTMLPLSLAFPFIALGSLSILMLTNSIMEIDRTFTSGQFAKFPGVDWINGVSSSIGQFMGLMSDISLSSVLGGVADIFGGGLTDIAESILEIDTIFSQGDFSRYPSMAWGNGVLGAIAKFNQIKDSLTGGFSMGGLLGGNDLSKTVSSITMLAVAFDKLGKAMVSFSNSISSIDNEKLASIRSLSSSVVLLSLMDPAQFEEMMDAMEDKSGIFGEFIEDFNNSRKEANTGGLSLFKSNSPEKAKTDAEILGPKLDKINSILVDISSVVGSNGSLRSYLNSKGKEVNLSSTKK